MTSMSGDFQQALKLKKAERRWDSLSDSLMKNIGFSFVEGESIEKQLTLAKWIIGQILYLRNNAPSKFMRMSFESFKTNINSLFSDFELSVHIALVHWEDVGAFKLNVEEFMEKAIKLIEFDGDGVYGCSHDRRFIFSIDYDPDYPKGAECEIIVSEV